MKKNKKKDDRKEFIVKFYGETKVMDHTEFGARCQVEKSNNIEPIRNIRTESIWYWISNGFLINMGALVTAFIMIVMICVWSSLLSQVTDLKEPFNLIGLMICVILIMTTIRVPNTISGWFHNDFMEEK